MNHQDPNIVIIGMGTVGKVLASAFAKKRNARTNSLHLIGRTEQSTHDIADRIRDLYGMTVLRHVCDARQTDSLIERLLEINPAIVINVATPDTHVSVMRACLEVGAHYLDTAVFELPGDFNVAAPWYNLNWHCASNFGRRD